MTVYDYELVKIGGSCATRKDEDSSRLIVEIYRQKGADGIWYRRREFINEEELRAVFQKGGPGRLKVVVLGAGPFGHALKKADAPAGDIHGSVRIWADEVREFLSRQGIDVYVVSPWDYVGDRTDDIRTDAVFWKGLIDKVRYHIGAGRVVVLHGDMARNGDKYEVMSGDYLVPLLATAFGFRNVAFVGGTPVKKRDGCTATEIVIQKGEGFKECFDRHGVTFWEVEGDVTRGMEGKCESAFNFVVETGVDVKIMSMNDVPTVIRRGW